MNAKPPAPKSSHQKHAPQLEIIRQTPGNQNAIIFIHGFTGHCVSTWRDFPEFVKNDPALSGWDIFCYGYESNLLPFFGFWVGNPPLTRLAVQLHTLTGMTPLGGYNGLALAAHSMGGLVVQQALVTSESFRNRVTHAFCYGTPSAGLAKARLGSFFNRQAKDMRDGGPFIKKLRARWKAKVEPIRGLKFFAIAGDIDEFVPATSSLSPFRYDQCHVVRGNHLEIVKPSSPEADSYRVFREGLLGEVKELPFLDAALVASERNDFRRVVATLEPHAAELDDVNMVKLIIALSELGEDTKVHSLLQTYHPTGATDFLGVWAGQLKRRWRLYGQRADINNAIDLYRQGCDLAEANGDHSQVLYHAINLAHLLEVGKHQRSAARDYARKAQAACAAATERDYWVVVTEAEACIYLNQFDRAAELYAEAIQLNPPPRHLKTTYQQAVYALPHVSARKQVLKAFGAPEKLAEAA